jgi:glycosyltransferase involved in cell wall biosynthesis
MAIDGVSRELVENADAGTYVEPENVLEYNRIIRFYLQNPEKIKELGENGYAYAKINFDRNVLANNYLDKLKELLNE